MNKPKTNLDRLARHDSKMYLNASDWDIATRHAAALSDRNFEYVKQADRELFERLLKQFVPPDIFDIHTHCYDARMFDKTLTGSTTIGWDALAKHQSAWMGDRYPTQGLLFPYPKGKKDMKAANHLLIEEIKQHPNCRGLLLIKPCDDPSDVEDIVKSQKLSGFKVYHRLAERTDTLNAEPGEFLPEWAWQIADKYGLFITLHLVLPHALADVRNQQYIRAHCQKYRNARLILAHGARGFCARHTIDGVHALRGLENVYFDTSAICDPSVFEALIRNFGTTRLLYGSDFPVSELRARPLSIGDGFYWLYEESVDWTDWQNGGMTLCGIQSLLAVKQACRTMCLKDSDVERIFCTNARHILNISPENSNKSGQTVYRKAKTLIPGGTQLFIKRPELYAPNQWPPYYSESRGCELIDLDGRRFVDFTTSGIGSCLLGYAHPDVNAAVIRRVQLGSMCTLNSPDEVELADLLVKMHPWAQNVRFARTGGESLAIAVRIARAATQRDVIAFCGYHGWSDWYLAANLSDDNTLDGHLLPGLSPKGVPRGLQGSVFAFNYNNLDEFAQLVKDHGKRLAAVVMEPTRSVEPAAGFLEGIRELCNHSGARLIFDEVSTGFRFYRGGVHLKYGIEPDIAVFAKALGNGHPIGAIVGKAETMQAAQETFISSTYWSEGVGFAAALATLKVMQKVDVPKHVARIGERMRKGCLALAKANYVPLTFSGHGGLIFMSFNHPDNAALMTLWTVRMLKQGFLSASAFYPTLAHKDHHVEDFLVAAEGVFAEIADSIEKGDIRDRIGGEVKHSGFARLT